LSDISEPWIRAPATSWLLLTLARARGVPVELVGCDFQVLQAALWAGVLLLVAAIAAMLFDRRTALASAALVALLPSAASVTLMLHADTLFCITLVGTLWALLLYARRRQHFIWLLLAGACAGAAALTRSQILPLLPALAIWMSLTAWWRG